MKRKSLLKKAAKIDLNISDKTEIKKMIEHYNQQKKNEKVPLQIGDKLILMVRPEDCNERYRQKYLKQHQDTEAEQRTGLAGQSEKPVQDHRRAMAGCQQRTATLRCRHREAAKHTDQLRPHPRAIQPRHEEYRGTADREKQPAQRATGNPASQIHGNTEHATAEILPGRTDYALTYSI